MGLFHPIWGPASAREIADPSDDPEESRRSRRRFALAFACFVGAALFGLVAGWAHSAFGLDSPLFAWATVGILLGLIGSGGLLFGLAVYRDHARRMTAWTRVPGADSVRWVRGRSGSTILPGAIFVGAVGAFVLGVLPTAWGGIPIAWSWVLILALGSIYALLHRVFPVARTLGATEGGLWISIVPLPTFFVPWGRVEEVHGRMLELAGSSIFGGFRLTGAQAEAVVGAWRRNRSLVGSLLEANRIRPGADASAPAAQALRP